MLDAAEHLPMNPVRGGTCRITFPVSDTLFHRPVFHTTHRGRDSTPEEPITVVMCARCRSHVGLCAAAACFVEGLKARSVVEVDAARRKTRGGGQQRHRVCG
jgi:hypothetical protein